MLMIRVIYNQGLVAVNNSLFGLKRIVNLLSGYLLHEYPMDSDIIKLVF